MYRFTVHQSVTFVIPASERKINPPKVSYISSHLVENKDTIDSSILSINLVYLYY